MAEDDAPAGDAHVARRLHELTFLQRECHAAHDARRHHPVEDRKQHDEEQQVRPRNAGDRIAMIRNAGNTSSRSTSTSKSVLSRPPKYPANDPTTAARDVAISAPSSPIISDFCIPLIVSANMSKPFCVVPNQCSADGGERNAWVSSWLYCQVTNNGLRYASANSSPTTARPTIARRVRNRRRATSAQREAASSMEVGST